MVKKILSKWYIYILVAASATTLFCVATSIKTAPSETQKVNFFIGAYNVNVNKLQDDLMDIKDKNIINITCTYHNLNSDRFSYFYNSFKENSDFYILPSKYVEDNKSNTLEYAANLNKNYLNNYFDDELVYYENDGYTKGFKIYDHLTDTGLLKEYVSYFVNDKEETKDDYYLFFRFSSVNLGETTVKSKTDHALKVIKNMREL